MKTIYYGDFCTKEGTCNRAPFEFTNKKEAFKTTRAIAEGNTLPGSTARWCVYANSTANLIKQGAINK